MSSQEQYSQPPPLPPRDPSGGRPQIPRRPVPPPLPMASKPTLAAAQAPPPPPVPRTGNVLDDPDVISHCPENGILYATAYWYSSPDAPDFEICSHCFASYIQSTHWASKFKRQLKPSDAQRRCRFSSPRMLQLWPQVLRNNDWAYISQYMARRAGIANCQGLTPLTADAGIQWYHLKNRDIDNFGTCAACYEDIVLATPFGSLFHSSPIAQPAGETWNCKMTEYARRAFEKFGKTNNWRDLAVTVGHVMKLPECDGETGAMAYKRTWYRPKPYINGMIICDACYFHFYAASVMELDWEPVHINAMMQGGWQTWVCDMTLLSLKIAYLKAMQQKSFQVFWKAANTIMASPVCPADAVYEGTWYALRSAREHAGVCTRCYIGVIDIFGFGNYFAPVRSAPDQTRMCIFNKSAPRLMPFLNRIDDAVSTRNFSRFQDFAVRFAGVPLCPTYNIVKDRKWYGCDKFLVCESCWEEFVKDTSLAPHLPDQGIVLPNACCDLYSSRMRGLWTEACAKGDMTEFIEFAKHRAAVYAQTVPRMQEILAFTKMRMMQKQTLLMSGIMLQGADNVVSASQGPGVHYTYGNASIGYGYATPAGAQGAQQFSQGLGMNVVNGSDMMQVAQLERIWKEVE